MCVWVQRETVLKVPLTGIVSATEMDSTTTMKTLRELTPHISIKAPRQSPRTACARTPIGTIRRTGAIPLRLWIRAVTVGDPERFCWTEVYISVGTSVLTPMESSVRQVAVRV
jgi:hypothetical protein